MAALKFVLSSGEEGGGADGVPGRERVRRAVAARDRRRPLLRRLRRGLPPRLPRLLRRRRQGGQSSLDHKGIPNVMLYF